MPTRVARSFLAALAWVLGRRRLSLVALAVTCAALWGVWMWFRDSSFASVQQVAVVGVRGPDAHAIEAALQRVALGTSTLDVNTAALRAATARFTQVRSLRVRASFPHRITITVIEQLPVAVLQSSSGARTAVAADGAVLGATLAGPNLPVVDASVLPSGSVHNLGELEILRVMGAAPAALVRFVGALSYGPKGVTASLRDGMVVYFGDASRPHAKWLSLARVLLTEGASAATYVDVRLPERPALGGLADAEAGQAEAAGTGSGSGTAATAGTSASLIAALQAALGASGQAQAAAGAPPLGVEPTEATAAPQQSAEPSASAPTGAGEGTSTAPQAGAEAVPAQGAQQGTG
jgi:cell division septal protein FtsQ